MNLAEALTAHLGVPVTVERKGDVLHAKTPAHEAACRVDGTTTTAYGSSIFHNLAAAFVNAGSGSHPHFNLHITDEEYASFVTGEP